MLPIVTEEKPQQLTLAIWDFVPHWAKQGKAKGVINARAESLIEKPYFRSAIAKQRCIIPADGFYEWQKSGSYRKPYFFHRKDDKPFNFAGVYNMRPDGSGNIGFAIITTNANPLVSQVHNRMPVILEEGEIETWLSSDTPLADIPTMLRPYQAQLMDLYPVSVLVNNTKNKGPEVMERGA